ncbi:MAG: pyridoxal-phosphate dependent enzyme [Pseudomonadota bacterium]
MPYAITQSDIVAAAQRIRPLVPKSPLVHFAALSDVVGKDVYCKLDTALPTGAFKVRGAVSSLTAQGDIARQSGAVAFSTGNHGRALAWAGAQLGVSVKVFMSPLVPQNKRDALAALGCEIVIVGQSQDDAETEALRVSEDTGALYVSPAHDPYVLAGQGTAALEIFEDLNNVGTLVVPISAGGLGAGVSVYSKAVSPGTQLIGVTMDRGAAMYESIKVGVPVQVEEVESLADSLGGGVGGETSLTFPIVRDLFDDLMLVTEEEIAKGMAWALLRERQVFEGAAGTCVGLLLRDAAQRFPGPIVFMGCGMNVDMSTLLDVANTHHGFWEKNQ